MALTTRQLSRRAVLAGACAMTAACAVRPSLSGAAANAEADALYDSHLHFFSNDIARYPIDPRNAREPEDIFRARIMTDPGTPEKIFALWQASGISAGTGVQYSGAYKTDNSYVLDMADRFPGKIRPEIIISARDPEAVSHLRGFAGSRRVAAVRLTGFVDATEDISWLNSPAALDIWGAANALGLPVAITFLPPKGASQSLSAIKTLADRFPDCTIILEHFGRLVDSDLAPVHVALAPYRKIHFKLTTNVIDELKESGRSTADFTRRAVNIYGPDRIMWGSDFGNTLRPYADMVADARAACAQLTETERRRLLHDNGNAMFKA
ncbi:MAG: amidohydrolase family protein [Blastomonas sp.]